MGEFLSYSIICGLLMLSMYLAYRMFMAKENQHGYNRGVLLMIYVASFIVLPVILSTEGLFVSSTSQIMEFDGIAIVDDMVMLPSKPIWGTVLIWIFLAGMIVVAVKTVVTWIRLINVIRSGEKFKQSGCTLVVTDNNKFAPFSWMKYVVISRNYYYDNYSAIAKHEMKHVACNHWVDLMVAQIVCTVNWFNPAAWLMREELMLVHEYQADMAVIDSGYNPQQYQMLLIKKAVGSRFPSLANSLNHSKLNKRITMMYKEKSGVGQRFKALTLVPMLALAIGVAAVPTVRAAVSTIRSSEVSVSKSSENRHADKISIKVFQVKRLRNSDDATIVTIEGENLGDHLSITGGTFTTNGKTNYAKSLQCYMTDGIATIIATFPRVDRHKKTSMSLIVNGDEIPFNLENFVDNSQN